LGGPSHRRPAAAPARRPQGDRAPFAGFVDVVMPHDGGFSGRATFRRRTFGRFELSPVP